jgi:hypothetical protein
MKITIFSIYHTLQEHSKHSQGWAGSGVIKTYFYD